MPKKLASSKNKINILLMSILLVFSIVIFVNVGTANVSISDTFKIIFSNVPIINKYIDITDISDSYINIIWKIRLPRVLLGVLVGSSLSVAGAAFQGMFKNPMADPFVIGISSGAALGATLGIVSGLSINILGMSSITIFAFLGALVSVLLVYNIARVNQKIPITTLLLSGVAVGQLFTAMMSLIMVLYDNNMQKIIYWTMGGLSAKGWDPVVRLSLPLILSMLALGLFSKELNILLLGEDSAKSMGINVEKTKRYIIILGSFMTALVVSVSGIIGFVGLIIPHSVRLVFGPDYKMLIPSSALMGAIFMIFADAIARTIISPTEIPVGIITALFGAPFFIYLLKNRKSNL